MEKVLKLIRDKKAKLESIISKAELITDKTENILLLIQGYKDECSQLTKAEKILNEGSVAATSKDEHENGFNHIHYPE